MAAMPTVCDTMRQSGSLANGSASASASPGWISPAAVRALTSPSTPTRSASVKWLPLSASRRRSMPAPYSTR